MCQVRGNLMEAVVMLGLHQYWSVAYAERSMPCCWRICNYRRSRNLAYGKCQGRRGLAYECAETTKDSPFAHCRHEPAAAAPVVASLFPDVSVPPWEKTAEYERFRQRRDQIVSYLADMEEVLRLPRLQLLESALTCCVPGHAGLEGGVQSPWRNGSAARQGAPTGVPAPSRTCAYTAAREN